MSGEVSRRDDIPLPPPIGMKVYALEVGALLRWNGSRWEDCDSEDDVDFRGAVTLRYDPR